MGDVLQIKPLLHGLHAKYPEAEIDVMVNTTYQPILENDPNIKKIIPIPRTQLHKAAVFHKCRKIFLHLLDELKQKRYDLILNRQFSRLEMNLIGALEATHKLGPYYLRKDNSIPFIKVLWESIYEEAPHRDTKLQMDKKTSYHFWNIINNRKQYKRNIVDVGLDLANISKACEFKMHIKETDLIQTHDFLKSTGVLKQRPLLGIQYGAGADFRKLTPNTLQKVLNAWLGRHGGHLVFFGTGRERTGVQSIINSLKYPELALNLAGRTSITQLAACLKFLDLLLCPDTGTMHLAAAVGTPTLSLFFGSAYPWETGPYGKDHLILHSQLACAPCVAPKVCPLDLFCKEMISPWVISNALDLAYDLIRAKSEAHKRDKLRFWLNRYAHDFRAKKLNLLHSGFQHPKRPMRPMELLASHQSPVSLSEHLIFS